MTDGASDETDTPIELLQQGQEDEIPKAPVRQQDVCRQQLIEQLAKEGQFRRVEIARGHTQDRCAQEGKQHDQAQLGEIGFGALAGRISGPVFWGIRRGQQGAIGGLGAQSGWGRSGKRLARTLALPGLGFQTGHSRFDIGSSADYG